MRVNDNNGVNISTEPNQETVTKPSPLIVDINTAKSTRFTSESFSNAELMVYEKSNDFALAYYNMPGNAQKLMIAGLTCVHNINKVNPISQEELDKGFWCSAPIVHVAKLMGYDVEEKANKSFYRAIKKAAEQVVKATVTMEDKEIQSFDTFSVINRILYNPQGDGRVYFHFTGGTSQYYLNNVANFTVYSLILNQHVAERGNVGAVRLAEVLKTNLFKAKKSPDGKVVVYYDYVDLRCMLSLVDMDDPRIDKILKSKSYAGYLNQEAVAYNRMLEIEKIDEWLSKTENGRYMKSNRTSKFTNYWNFVQRVLDPTQKVFLQCIRDYPDLMDMVFEYEPRKYRSKVIGIYFTIYTVEAYKKKELEQGVQMSLFDILGEFEGKQNDDIERIEDASVLEVTQGDVENEAKNRKRSRKKKSDLAVENMQKLEKYFASVSNPQYKLGMTELFILSQSAPAETIIEKYELMERTQGVREPLKWMVAAIQKDFKDVAPAGKPSTGKNNKFNNFQQNEYDFEELESKLVANNFEEE